MYAALSSSEKRWNKNVLNCFKNRSRCRGFPWPSHFTASLPSLKEGSEENGNLYENYGVLLKEREIGSPEV